MHSLKIVTIARRKNCILLTRKLRRGMAARLRAKVARLFSDVMGQYFSGSDETNQRSGIPSSMAHARMRVIVIVEVGEKWSTPWDFA